MAEEDPMANVKFAPGKKFGEWVIKKRLDEGGFGQVYLVENAKKDKAALKAESNEVEGGSAIKLETMILKQLNKTGPVPHIPIVFHAAKRNKYCYMVMTLLGENLKHLKTDQPKERFTRGTWSRVGIQCLYSLKYLHDCGFIHRDIKPQNFVMGHPEDGARSRMVHILDFGLARPFASYSEKLKKWVARKARGTAEFRGTLRYTSPNVHNRKEQGRVDDVWSLLYVLIELNGGLPWQTEKEREKVEQMKMNMADRAVMQNMPPCMSNILPHLKSLDYYQRPDYHLLFKSLWQVMVNEKATTSAKYDWETPEQEEAAKKFKPADWEKPDGQFFTTDPTGINGPADSTAPSELVVDALKSVDDSNKMNLYSDSSSTSSRSFINIGYTPDDGEPDFFADDEAVIAPKPRNQVKRPMLTSTPRVVCRISQHSHVAVFTRESQPMMRMAAGGNEEEEDDEFRDVSENSQGYRYFYQASFLRQRHGFNFLPQVSKASKRFIDLVNRKLISRNLSGDAACDDSEPLEIEVARDNDEYINLSEIFHHVSPIAPKLPPNYNDNTPTTATRTKNDDANMGSIHRSDQMHHFQMIFARETAYNCIAEIGKMPSVQFIDLNSKVSLYARDYVDHIRRCEEMERKIRWVEMQLIRCVPEIDPHPIDFENLTAPTMAEINAIDARLDALERDIRDLNTNDQQLRQNLNSAKEFHQCMHAVEEFFRIHKEEDPTRSPLRNSSTAEDSLFSKSFNRTMSEAAPNSPLLGPGEDNAWFIAGVLLWDKRASFETVLWRASRRTAFVKCSDDYFVVEDPETLEPVKKCVFISFFKGDALGLIIDKACDGFKAQKYPCPKTSKERSMKMSEMEGRITDLAIVIETTQKHKHGILQEVAPVLPEMLRHVSIRQSVFHVMNMFTKSASSDKLEKSNENSDKFLFGECWIPGTEEENVRAALKKSFSINGSQIEPVLREIESSAIPPTYHRTNKFTKVFQSIVDSYGVSQYREVNPAPYIIITFPFLFAIMFGDAAHGFILLLAALYFVINEESLQKTKKDEIFNTFFGGRYIMLLMGVFSIYTGFLYNDAFAKAFNIFGSSWKNSANMTVVETLIAKSYKNQKNYVMELVPELAYNRTRGPYPFGVDPIWNIAENRLVFLNSMKMKASVIIGITQMTFGVFLSALNHIHFKSYIDIFTNFIPQLIFLSSIFIYLCVQIVVKWVFFTVSAENVLGYEYPGSHCAPSLLIGLINMFMFKKRREGYWDGNSNETVHNCHLVYWYPNQQKVETVLLSVALGCVPIMLFGKPIWAYFTMKRRLSKRRRSKINGNMEDIELLSQHDDLNLDESHPSAHSMSDIFVHQAIHTIEFVLGCVSHTASYLRLWALSLAHAQLSEVMWHMVLINGLSLADSVPSFLAPVVTALSFFIFAILSLSILIMMEGLSAFLHALRLHWVEFQSKFYIGTGHKFQPFHLKDGLENAKLITDEADRAVDVIRGVK